MQYPFINYFSNRSGTIDITTLNSTLNRLLKNYNGEVHSHYVKSEKYKVVGIVFASTNARQEEAESFFELELSKVIKVPKVY